VLPVARVSPVLSDLFHTTVSQASVQEACQSSAQRVAPVRERIRMAFQQSRVVPNEETGFRVLGKRWWLHVACRCAYTLSLAHPKRGDDALKAMEVLPGDQGISVHETLAMDVSSPCQHALCVAHDLRELTFAHEQFQQSWAEPMQRRFRSLHVPVEQARGAGKKHLPEQDQQDSRLRSRDLVEMGLAAHPPPTARSGKRGAIKKCDVLNLLLRQQQQEDLLLHFMTNFEVPLTNHPAETDVRLMKRCQKISGCFRTVEGSAIVCALRSSLSTMQQQGVPLLTALASTCTATPRSPPFLEAE
jgi:transposase